MAFKMKGVPHYMQDGTEYKGDTHKMKDGTLHTGKTHTGDSEPLSHKKPPFEMKAPFYAAGMWANIHAKKKRGEAPAGPGDPDRPKKKEWDKNTK